MTGYYLSEISFWLLFFGVVFLKLPPDLGPGVGHIVGSVAIGAYREQDFQLKGGPDE